MHGVRRDFVQLIKLCLGLAHLIISSNYLYIAWPSNIQINSTIISIDLSLIGEILIHFLWLIWAKWANTLFLIRTKHRFTHFAQMSVSYI